MRFRETEIKYDIHIHKNGFITLYLVLGMHFISPCYGHVKVFLAELSL